MKARIGTKNGLRSTLAGSTTPEPQSLRSSSHAQEHNLPFRAAFSLHAITRTSKPAGRRPATPCHIDDVLWGLRTDSSCDASLRTSKPRSVGPDISCPISPICPPEINGLLPNSRVAILWVGTPLCSRHCLLRHLKGNPWQRRSPRLKTRSIT